MSHCRISLGQLTRILCYFRHILLLKGKQLLWCCQMWVSFVVLFNSKGWILIQLQNLFWWLQSSFRGVLHCRIEDFLSFQLFFLGHQLSLRRIPLTDYHVDCRCPLRLSHFQFQCRMGMQNSMLKYDAHFHCTYTRVFGLCLRWTHIHFYRWLAKQAPLLQEGQWKFCLLLEHQHIIPNW